MTDSENKVIIKPHGFGIYCVMIIYAFLISCSIYLIVSCFLKNTSFTLYMKIIAIILGLLIIGWAIYQIYNLFKKSAVVFSENKIKIKGGDIIWKPINVNCNMISSFKISTMGIVFIINGKRKTFNTIQFTKKQVLRILYEIKQRGGLQDQPIELK